MRAVWESTYKSEWWKPSPVCSVSYTQKTWWHNSILSIMEVSEHVLFWRQRKQSSKHWTNIRQCGTVSSGERTVWFGSRGIRQMSEPLGNCSMIKAVYTIWTGKNRPKKNEGENDLVTATIMLFSFYSSWKIIWEKLSHRKNREALCYSLSN